MDRPGADFKVGLTVMDPTFCFPHSHITLTNRKSRNEHVQLACPTMTVVECIRYKSLK